jgi:hypothetical protein
MITSSVNNRPGQSGNVRAPENLPHACRCGARWSGTGTCHCGACHVTTTGISTFAQHRPRGACAPPATVGLVVVPGRAYKCWGTISNDPAAAPVVDLEETL